MLSRVSKLPLASKSLVDCWVSVPWLLFGWMVRICCHALLFAELDDKAQTLSYEHYYPYGSTAIIAGKDKAQTQQKRYRYTGKERDDSSGLSIFKKITIKLYTHLPPCNIKMCHIIKQLMTFNPI
jgi:hypothetical protein